MTELPGCVSSVKFISSSDLPVKDRHPSDYVYIVNTRRTDNPRRNKSYILNNILISNGYLTADRYTPASGFYSTVQIFVASDSLINKVSDKSVKIALDDIYKVRVQEIDNLLLWGYLLVGFVATFLLIDYIFGPLPSTGPLI
jgi:hypothetical protein